VPVFGMIFVLPPVFNPSFEGFFLGKS